MGTSIKLHNKTLDKTSAIVSPDNQTEDLEIKLPNKNGTLATTDDLGTATNEERVVEIINKTVSENKDTVEKVVESLAPFKKADEGKEINGIYIQKTSASGKESYIKALDRALFWSVGEGEPIKGADKHFRTLKQAFQEASYYRKCWLGNVEQECIHTNTTTADVKFRKWFDNSTTIKANGGTFVEKTYFQEGMYRTPSPSGTGCSNLSYLVGGKYESWKDDFNIARKHYTLNRIFIVVKKGYVDQDFHAFWYGEDLSHVTLYSQDDTLLIDTETITKKFTEINGIGDGSKSDYLSYIDHGLRLTYWMSVRERSHGPTIRTIHIKPLKSTIGSRKRVTVGNALQASETKYVFENQYPLYICIEISGNSDVILDEVKITHFYYGINVIESVLHFHNCVLDRCVCGVNCYWYGKIEGNNNRYIGCYEPMVIKTSQACLHGSHFEYLKPADGQLYDTEFHNAVYGIELGGLADCYFGGISFTNGAYTPGLQCPHRIWEGIPARAWFYAIRYINTEIFKEVNSQNTNIIFGFIDPNTWNKNNAYGWQFAGNVVSQT